MMAQPQPDGNVFRALWTRGYKRLVPIVPPDAVLWAESTLARNPACRGKAVGRRRQDGTWSSWNWVAHETTEADLEAWHAMGAGVGIKTGKQPDGTYLIGIDADTPDEQLAARVSGLVRKHFGIVPTRHGRAPKALYVVRLGGELKYTQLRLTTGDKPEIVELLSDNRQFVAHGIHPGTMKPYQWVEKLRPYDELPIQALETLT
jgi:hypothetical protein